MMPLNLNSKSKSLLIILVGACIAGFHAFQMYNANEELINHAESSTNLITSTAIDPIVSTYRENENQNLENEDSRLFKLSEVFQSKMDQMRICLELTNSITEISKPTYENVYQSVMNDFGNSFIAQNEWSNTHIELPNGEQRRIRIETDALNEEKTYKKLSYFEVDSENLPVLIPLKKEISMNPSDEIIQNLESEGKVTLKENASRVYFAGGDQVYYTEKNGLLSELEVQNKFGRIFKCSSLYQTESQCRCL